MKRRTDRTVPHVPLRDHVHAPTGMMRRKKALMMMASPLPSTAEFASWVRPVSTSGQGVTPLACHGCV